VKIQERTGAGAGRSAAPTQPSVGDRLPTPPRERKPALAALAVLLILVGALGATMLVLQAGDRIEVVQVTDTVQPGESVKGRTAAVLVAADDSINYVRWEQLGTLEKLKAKSTIYKGTVVIGDMFGEQAALPDGKASVGLALKEGQYPADISPGDTVAAYRVGDGGSGSGSRSDSGSGSGSSSGTPAGNALIVDSATVNKVQGDSSDGQVSVSTGNLSLTLLVDQSDAPELTEAASAGEVAVVLVPGKN
jgi:hypothetical protein